MKYLILRTGVLAGIILAASGGPVVAAPSPVDSAFVTQAEQGGMAEVADGRLAQAKSSNAAVLRIARRMVADHSKADTALASIATAEGLAVPSLPAPADRAMMARQRTMSGMAFDMAYLRGQQTAHVQAIALFRHEIASGSDRRIVGFARRTLPTVQEHLMMIRQALGAM